ncbi:MAG: T9SS type A sorting domain-containing protein [Bacteroidia bacterium]|nr:T9SS type A sorting domain-containing protein [Bacteroidia bacterium]MCZ2248045.1 T9SS type A sorting domain-containing protein [Bacteroidia bacterium]
MGAFTQSFAQSGNSCSTPIALGTLKDSTYRVTFNYPDTVKWISFNDLAGRSVLSPKLLSNQTIDCSCLEKGMYLLEISYQNSKSETFKINIVK